MKKHRLINNFIAAVWFMNGLLCKVLNMVPRHKMIVERILGQGLGESITKAIGLSEVAMALWILTGYKSRWCSWLQIVVVGSMNVLEFVLARDLLLFGPWNAVLAALLMCIIYLNEYRFKTN